MKEREYGVNAGGIYGTIHSFILVVCLTADT